MSHITARKRLASLAGQQFGGDRDLYQVMGYKRDLTVEDYIDVYLRGDIGARIVDAYPDATWREAPEVKGDASFVDSFEAVAKKHRLWRTLHRLDRLMNLGHYGALVMGLDGGEQMDQPAEGSDYSLLYLQPHSERTAEITKWEDNPNSPRYGMPEMYRVTTGVNWTGAGAGQKSVNVHHSRVIHVAERALEDASIGTPRLERIMNRLFDLDKLLGAGAEIYWQNVAMLMVLSTDADTELDPEDAEEVAEQVEEMQHGLRRWLRLRGMTANNIAPGMQGSDPGTVIEWMLKIIAGSEGIPQRILLGNEAGELASSQDETAWASRVSERREQLATPSFIEAFTSAGLRLGFLSGQYSNTEWPEADTLGEQGRAEVADRKASAVQKYMSTPGAELVVTPDEFRKTLGYDGELRVEDEPPIDESDAQVVAQFRARR